MCNRYADVEADRVSVKIDDLLAVTSVDEEFYNPNNQRLEGLYLFPLPPGSHIDRFSMDINGQMTDAELLSADKARSLYEDIVRRYCDPALLEYSGRDCSARPSPGGGNSPAPRRPQPSPPEAAPWLSLSNQVDIVIGDTLYQVR